jgi:hypothetical protein
VRFAVERLTVAICNKSRFLLRTLREKRERERERERKNFLHRRENRTLGDIEKKRARDGESENNSVYFV